MTSVRKAIQLGLLIWLVPFVVAVLVFPLKTSWRSLFESIMPVTVSAVATASAAFYFRGVQVSSLREGLAVGLVWMAISVAIDLPLMLSPPIRMPLLEYAADIGLTYLMIPVITLGITAARRGPTT